MTCLQQTIPDLVTSEFTESAGTTSGNVRAILHGNKRSKQKLQASHAYATFHLVLPHLRCSQVKLKKASHILQHAELGPHEVNPRERSEHEVTLRIISFPEHIEGRM
jgi:hypothetical protein